MQTTILCIAPPDETRIQPFDTVSLAPSLEREGVCPAT